MPTAVEYDPEKGGVPAVQSNASQPGPIQDVLKPPGPGCDVMDPGNDPGEVYPGPIQDVLKPPGPIVDVLKPPGAPNTPGSASGRGLFTGGVFLMIIAVLIIGVLFLPSQTLMDVVGCPTGLNGDGKATINGGITPVNQVNGDGHSDPGANNTLIALLRTISALRVRILGSQTAFPPNPCLKPVGGLTGGPQTPEPTEPVSKMTATATPIVINPPLNGPAAGPACTPNPGDGICSACENSDLDSADCVCNMNGVCDPHEGFNCPDCQPTAVPGGDKPGGKSGGGKKPPCPPTGIACP